MKKLFTFCLIAALSIGIVAQAPQRMSYQAVIRNSSDQLVTNHVVGMQISILQGSVTGTPVYVETQSPTTNENGLITIEIGGGTIVTGTIAGIDWLSGPYFLKTETNPAGGTNYSITGTSQLLSVPYSMHSKDAENGFAYVYKETDNRPVLGSDGSLNIGVAPIDGMKLNIRGLTNITPGANNSWGTALFLDSRSLAGGINYGMYSLSNGSTEGGGKLLISNDNGGSKFIIDKDGKVGLGNLNPAFNLDVSGDINFTGGFYKNGSPFSSDFNTLINKPTTLAGYEITDAMSTNHIANGITSTMINNWNTAFGWGNHSGLYRTVSWVPTWTEVTGKPALATVATTGSYNDLSNKPSILNSQWITSASNIYYTTGYVGIGSNSPAAALDVTGNAFFRNTIVPAWIEINSNTTGNRNSGIDFHGDDTYSDYALRIIRVNTGADAISQIIHRGLGELNLYTQEAAPIRFYTSTTNRMTIAANGNVGIGTATPMSLLNPYMIIGDALNSNAEIMNLTIKPTNNTATLRFYGIRKVAGNNWNDVSLRIQQQVDGTDMGYIEFNPGTSGYDLAFGTNNAERLRISQNGNVGIGQINPTAKLDVNGQINVNNNNVTNVATPVNSTDAATKAYVDNNVGKHFIGESYGDGVVFYIYDNGQHGLIAAPLDGFAVTWGSTNIVTNAFVDGVGAGYRNTNFIAIANGIDHPNIGIVEAMTNSSHFGDWYIPSKYELNLLYLQKNIVGNFSNFYYWSSNEVITSMGSNAYCQFFGDGSQGEMVKSSEQYFRHIRAF
jgi:hypothetical protein